MRTDTARDTIVAEFMRLSKDPDDTLVMLDCDHEHPENILETLVNDDAPVVTSLAVRSNPSFPAPCMWKNDSNGIPRIPTEWKEGLDQYDVVGAGAIAIKRSVFEKLKNAGYDQMYFFYQYEPGDTRVSDEIGFSQMCNELQIPMYVDTRIESPHCIAGTLDKTSWKQYCDEHPVVIKEHKVSVVIPQRGRIEKFRKALDTLLSTAPQAEVIVVIDEDDNESWSVAFGEYSKTPIRFLRSTDKSPLAKWNYGASHATGDVIVAASNDVEFQSQWLEYALDALTSVPDDQAMVAFNDTVTTPEVSSPHFLMTRKYIVKYNGGVLMPSCYAFQFADVENRLRAQSLGRYVCAKASIVKHLHPMTNTASKDEIHEQGAYKYFEQDQKLFLSRKTENFPITWEAVVK